MTSIIPQILFIANILCVNHLVVSTVADYDICESDRIISAFRLRNSLFFHVSKGQGMDTRYELFKYTTPAPNDPTEPLVISANYKDKPSVKVTHLLDYLKWAYKYDLSSPITAYILTDEFAELAVNVCRNSIQSKPSYCDTYLSVYEQMDYDILCIYDKTQIADNPMAVRYNYTANTFTFVLQDSYFETECLQYLNMTFPPKFTHESRQLVSIIQDISPVGIAGNGSFALFQRVDRQTIQYINDYYLSEDYQMNASILGYDMDPKYPIRTLITYGPMYSHSPRVVWGCGDNCTLTTPLTTVAHGFGTGVLFWEHDATNCVLLRCCDHPVPYNPFDFCAQKYRFDSVFTLGQDIYFQKSARFWRLVNSFGFTEQSFPNWADFRTKPVRNLVYDQNVADLLINEDIDLSQNIYGFSYKSTEYSEKYPCKLANRKWDKKCINNILYSKRYQNVCLFGYSLQETNKTAFMKHNLKALAYGYSPKGIYKYKPYGKDYGHNNFCQHFVNYIDHYLNNVGIRRPTAEFRALTGYQLDVHNKLYNVVLFWTTSAELNDYNHYIYTIKWSVDTKYSEYSPHLNISEVMDTKCVIKSKDKDSDIMALFIHNKDIVSYVKIHQNIDQYEAIAIDFTHNDKPHVFLPSK